MGITTAMSKRSYLRFFFPMGCNVQEFSILLCFFYYFSMLAILMNCVWTMRAFLSLLNGKDSPFCVWWRVMDQSDWHHYVSAKQSGVRRPLPLLWTIISAKHTCLIAPCFFHCHRQIRNQWKFWYLALKPITVNARQSFIHKMFCQAKPLIKDTLMLCHTRTLFCVSK